METVSVPIAKTPFSLVSDFYWISMKKMPHIKFRYGQQTGDGTILYVVRSIVRYRKCGTCGGL